MDANRFKEKPSNNSDCFARECKHCKIIISFPWKINGKSKSKPADELGSYHVTHAARHLEKHFDETGRTSIEQRVMQKNEKAKK